MSTNEDQPIPASWEDLETLRDISSLQISELLIKISDSVGHTLVEHKDTIYQYTDVVGLKGMLEKHAVWATSIGYLNDVSERYHGLNLFVDLIEEFIAHPEDGIWKQVLIHLLPSIRQADANNVFAACFTTHGDQLSQWRGYAANGYGYSIGFETSSLMDIKPDPLVLDVLYGEDQQRRFAEELLRDGIVEVHKILVKSKIEPTPLAIASILSFAVQIMLPALKHPGFSEEKEFRMFVKSDYDPDNNKAIFFHERKGLLVPHISLRWGESKLPIREIIVGPNLDFDLAKWSLKQLLEQQGYESVKIKPSSIPYLA